MNRQELLKACLEKIEAYRDMVKSEYPGGVPLQILLPELREAVANPQCEAEGKERMRANNALNAHLRNVQEAAKVFREDMGHVCQSRVAVEAIMQRSQAALDMDAALSRSEQQPTKEKP